MAFRNRLLAVAADLAPLGDLRPFEFKRGEHLYRSGEAIDELSFVEHGLIGIAAPGGGDVWTMGVNGVIGGHTLFFTPMSLFDYPVRVGGDGLRIERDAFRSAIDRSQPLRQLIERYGRASVRAVSQNAECRRRHSVEQRTCRWLMLARDGLGVDELSLSEVTLAAMIGADRSRVSLICSALAREGLISISRGRISIVDVGRLAGGACQCYRIVRLAEMEYLGL